MEYLKVILNFSKEKESSKTSKEDFIEVQPSVLINGEANGFVEDVLTIEEGFVIVSADISQIKDAKSVETKEIELSGTSVNNPLIVGLNVES